MAKKKASKKTAPAKAGKTEKVDDQVSAAAKHSHADGKHLTKADRQKRLFARTGHKPGEATQMRGKAYRQKSLLERYDHTR